MCIILSLGLSNLLNSSGGMVKGHEQWPIEERMKLGVREFMSAFKLYGSCEQRIWRLRDIALTTDEVRQSMLSGRGSKRPSCREGVTGSEDDVDVFDVEKVRPIGNLFEVGEVLIARLRTRKSFCLPQS